MVLGVPGYIFFRERMVKKPLHQRSHSGRRVVKLTAINFVLNLMAALYFTSFFVLILQRTSYLHNPLLLVQIMIYLIIVWLTFYGNGIYLTSIVLEDFTLPDLRVVKSFKTQFIATHLFHGPISHILIYSGWMSVMLILAIVDSYLKLSIPTSYWPILLVSGGMLGVLFAFGQIYNGTAVYQFMTGTVSSVIIAVILIFNQISLSFVPVAAYFVGFAIAFELSLGSYLSYLLVLKIKKKHVVWDKSGGAGEIDADSKLIDRIFK
jgi:hypothetical protein